MHVKQVAFLFILLSIISCKESTINGEFLNKTMARWNFGSQLSWINPHYIDSEKISEPKGVYSAVFEVEFIGADFNKYYDCINYITPKESFDGELYIIPNPKRLKCKDLDMDNSYVALKKIRNFGFEMQDSSLLLKVDEHRFKYKFLNYKMNKKNEILSNSIASSLVEGIQIASEVKYETNHNILKNGEICFDISDDCTVTMEENCQSCEGGYYEVVASACQSKRRKVCGINNCGKKNQIACFRGYLASGIDPENYCVQDSPVGFCNKGLRVVCINSVLMCE